MLDNFPSLRTLIIEQRAQLTGIESGSKAISILTGDFLMPYLLSTVDKGSGMMAMLNSVPIDYLTFGNHEHDLAHEDMLEREREYSGTWINSNMQSHQSFKDSPSQVATSTIEVRSADGSNVRRVGMLSALTNHPSLYKPGAFGGAHIEDPWDTMDLYKQQLEGEGVDFVLPLCHLYEPEDDMTARRFDFPVILSGHDHHRVDRMSNGSRLLKPGSDAHLAVILDISWANNQSKAHVDAKHVRVSDWLPDERLAEMVVAAYAPLEPLRQTQLATVPHHYQPFTSVGVRDGSVSAATFLCTMLREALNMLRPDDVLTPSVVGTGAGITDGERGTFCDLVCIKGGMFKAGRDYTPAQAAPFSDEQPFTLEMLQGELMRRGKILICHVPGRVLRVALRETWQQSNPGWLQMDDGVECDEEGYVVSVNGKPLDPDRLYRIGSFPNFRRPRDAPTIGAYFETHPLDWPAAHREGQGAVDLIVKFCAAQAWVSLLRLCDKNEDSQVDEKELLSALDLDLDGSISRDELKRGVSRLGLRTHEAEDTLVDAMVEQQQNDFGFALQGGSLSTAVRHAVLLPPRESPSSADSKVRVRARAVSWPLALSSEPAEARQR
jgi:hypothetical protein